MIPLALLDRGFYWLDGSSCCRSSCGLRQQENIVPGGWSAVQHTSIADPSGGTRNIPMRENGEGGKGEAPNGLIGLLSDTTGHLRLLSAIHPWSLLSPTPSESHRGSAPPISPRSIPAALIVISV